MPDAPALDHFVFAYGSLTAAATGVPAVLRGFRRVWGVAMDNAETISGYKCYRSPDGSRPDVCVAYLDIVPGDPASAVDGLLLAVDEVALPELDDRERNYHRVDVTGSVDVAGDARAAAPAPGRVWTYVGREDSRRRLARARAAGRAVVDAAYARSVERWSAGTEPSGLPHLELHRVDLPRTAPPAGA